MQELAQAQDLYAIDRRKYEKQRENQFAAYNAQVWHDKKEGKRNSHNAFHTDNSLG